MSSFLSTSNYSFYAVPAAWGLSIVCHFYSINLYNKSRKGDDAEWDNAAPRQHVAALSRKTNLTPAERKVLRGEAAQQNGFENLAFFAAAVVAGNVAHLPSSTLNTFVAVYLASRVAYSLLYINVEDNKLSALRSVAFLTGIGSIFTMFIQAAASFQ